MSYFRGRVSLTFARAGLELEIYLPASGVAGIVSVPPSYQLTGKTAFFFEFHMGINVIWKGAFQTINPSCCENWGF
jgi:hypothetical protein